MTTEPINEAEPLLVVVVDSDGDAMLTIRDDVDTDRAIEWLHKSVEHLRELRNSPPAAASTDDDDEGTVQP